jgi:hypothetical protein
VGLREGRERAGGRTCTVSPPSRALRRPPRSRQALAQAAHLLDAAADGGTGGAAAASRRCVALLVHEAGGPYPSPTSSAAGGRAAAGAPDAETDPPPASEPEPGVLSAALDALSTCPPHLLAPAPHAPSPSPSPVPASGWDAWSSVAAAAERWMEHESWEVPART